MQDNIKKIIFIIFSLTSSIGQENINKAMDLYMQGELSIIEKDLHSAEKYFNQALYYSPNNPEILLSLSASPSVFTVSKCVFKINN